MIVRIAVPRLLVLVVALLVPLTAVHALPEVALQRHMTQIGRKLANVTVDPKENRVGVLSLAGDRGTMTRDKLEAVLLDTGKFEAFARDGLDRLIIEIEFQEGVEVDGKTAKELKLKGVDFIVTGAVAETGAGAGRSVRLNLTMTNCSTGGRKFVYNEEVLVSMDDVLTRTTQTMGPATIVLIGFVLLFVLVIFFKVFRGVKTAASNTIFATVNDYLLSDKKIREVTAAELRGIKNNIKDAGAACEGGGKGDFATAINAIAGDIDLLSQTVNGAPFGQDIAQYRAIPRDVADRLKSADLAFTDRVADLGRNVARVKELANQKRFEGLEADVERVKSEVAGLKDKFEERGRILRSF